MTGRILGISGPTVSSEPCGLTLYERVYVGNAMLTGEVVRLEQNRSIIQVYEDTRGLAVGEPVKGVGLPLTVRLGPGLLSGMFDGLQRPLVRLRQEMGPFITRGSELQGLDYQKKWDFAPTINIGEEITHGKTLGFVKEGALKHYITCGPDIRGELKKIMGTEFRLDEPIGEYDSGRMIYGWQEWPVRSPRPYLKKIPPAGPLVTGQRSIDFLFPIAKGGTAIFPGGFGTGKTILEQAIAKFADIDVVVYVGCGERGNEMAEMIEEFEDLKDPWTGKQLMERTILVVNTSNMPVAAREASIYTAVTMAEYYRDMGYNVLFLADSLSRWAEALREISSSLQEMPGEEGYPTYLASRLSCFFERAGMVETLGGRVGSVTMILSVSPPGGDFTEPVTQACLRAAGVFLMLDKGLAHRRHFPAINWFQSYSLYSEELGGHFTKNVSPEWQTLQSRCREVLQKEEVLREVFEIVGAEGLQDADRLLMLVAEKIRTEFLSQNAYGDDAFSPPEKTVTLLRGIFEFYDRAGEEIKQGITLEDVLKSGARP